MSFLQREQRNATAQEQAKRDVKPPGGECHDVFGTNCDSSIVFPSTNSQAEQQPHHRITKPPGGETSDIFTTTPTSTPPSTPRKVKNYMASTIFTPDAQSAEQQHKIRHRPDDGSFHRLFGASDSPQSSPHHQANGHGDTTDGQLTPRGKNHQKSNVLFAENGKANGHTNGTNGHGANGHATNGTNGHGANGHGTNGNDTGKIQNGGDSGSSSGSATPVGNGHANGHTNGHGNGHVNGHKTNGHSNGTNGTNGSHEGSPNGGTPGKRIPPGGFSSKLW